MFSAVSGLKAHMSALSVIGNNVSNVNTLGYKATRYTFNEAIYSTARDGSDGSVVLGGRNPAQVGYGANIGTIDLDMSSKNYSPTGRALDVMIDGDGFFIVGDKVTEDGSYGITPTDMTALKTMDLSRLGNFEIDPNGYLIDGNGSVVWGFLEREATAGEIAAFGDGVGSPLNNIVYEDDGKTIKSATMTVETLTAMRIPMAKNYDVTYPQMADATGKPIVKTYTDANGKTTFYREATASEIAAETFVTTLGDPRYTDGTTSYVAVEPTQVLDTNEVYDSTATTRYYSTGSGAALTYSIETKTTRDPVSGEIKTETKYYDNSNTEVTDPVTITGIKADIANGTVAFHDSETSYTAVPNTATSRLQPDTVSINEKTGALTVMTSDEQLVVVGYLAIAKVTNPNGVTHVDGRYYQALEGAGDMRLTTINGVVTSEDGSIGDAADTGLITGGLESSGTDLATEITNMITVQRGYQANTRVITVTDSMLEELVNLKR